MVCANIATAIFSMGVTQQGIDGEQMLFKWLKNKNVVFFQPDAIGYKNGKHVLYECKHQARFKAPPFDGHGLPYWQVKTRLMFQIETNISCILVVFDSETNEIFYQYLDVLEQGEHFDTKGDKPRRIYKLTSFLRDTGAETGHVETQSAILHTTDRPRGNIT